MAVPPTPFFAKEIAPPHSLASQLDFGLETAVQMFFPFTRLRALLGSRLAAKMIVDSAVHE